MSLTPTHARPLRALAAMAFALAAGCVTDVEPQPAAALSPELPAIDPLSCQPPGYLCYRADTPVTVDGRLDDDAWAGAPWTAAFRDIEGELRPAPRHETRAKMLWDDDYLYVGAHLVEPNVWATLTEHDSVIFHDNDFEVFIDPDGDRHQYYEYEINALGTDWDLRLVKTYNDGAPALNEWEIPGLKRGVHVEGTLSDPGDEDEYWSIEIAFPWEVLAEYANRPAPPRDRDQWRISFSRVEWDVSVEDGKTVKVPDRSEHNWTWTNQHAINMHRPEFWAYVQFTTAAAGQGRYLLDATRPARESLMEVYEAMRSHRERHTRYPESLEALDLDLEPNVLASIRLQSDGETYTASLSVLQPDESVTHLSLRQDGRLWQE